VIGFVSQFFFIDIGSLSSSTLAVPRAQTAGLAATTTRAKAHGWMPPRGVRHDDSDSPGEGVFVDRRHRRKSRNPGVASLTSPRNFINTAAGGSRVRAGVVPPVTLSDFPDTRRVGPDNAHVPSRASTRTDADADRYKRSQPPPPAPPEPAGVAWVIDFRCDGILAHLWSGHGPDGPSTPSFPGRCGRVDDRT
jgi:hypothetical protein